MFIFSCISFTCASILVNVKSRRPPPPPPSPPRRCSVSGNIAAIIASSSPPVGSAAPPSGDFHTRRPLRLLGDPGVVLRPGVNVAIIHCCSQSEWLEAKWLEAKWLEDATPEPLRSRVSLPELEISTAWDVGPPRWRDGHGHGHDHRPRPRPLPRPLTTATALGLGRHGPRPRSWSRPRSRQEPPAPLRSRVSLPQTRDLSGAGVSK